ncbi:hypothetical protein [Undibacterium aquatile]|uniref:Lipoprotein n=1 Tax=Undibacterium aquatile TaxID=1537398 RepID=A0ABR6XBR8_9BURK|nr:hypothetical protein [Undibacterium aquatile]MBC3810351.1 hypothetical protein [Undibacterium aquatile]
MAFLQWEQVLMKTFFRIAILIGMIAQTACTRESTQIAPGKLTVRWELPPQKVTMDVNREAPTIDPQLDQQLRTIGSYQLTKKIIYQDGQQTDSYVAEFVNPISEEKRKQAIPVLVSMLDKYTVSVTSEGNKKLTTKTISQLPW